MKFSDALLSRTKEIRARLKPNLLNPPKPCHFFRLPAEIRIQIYRLLLVEPLRNLEPVLLSYLYEPRKPRKGGKPWPKYQQQNRAEYSAFLVNRQFHGEYAAVVYGESQFIFTQMNLLGPVGTAKFFLNEIGPINSRNISHLVLHVLESGTYIAIELLQVLNERSESFKSLEITLGQDTTHPKVVKIYHLFFTKLKTFDNTDSLTVHCWNKDVMNILARDPKGWVRYRCALSTPAWASKLAHYESCE
jgi:hypothetical protein